MGTYHDDKEAICPFFVRSERRKIVCEGIIEGSLLHLIYESEGDRDTQRRVFCDREYDKCEVHSMLMQKYEEG